MKHFLLLFLTSLLFLSCYSLDKKQEVAPANGISSGDLPAPYASRSSTNFSNVIGWKNGRIPIAPDGFTVTVYASGFENPRWMYLTPNGDVLVQKAIPTIVAWKSSLPR